ncbi:prepilin peptidase [Lagierella sp.]|uniref:prepilin peptidase n=1 Tax=Lagierella sp. TaxID=2849657 RepID=UPI0026396D76|nr:prepilin peptidase [Lagierella sp.]
MGLFIFVLGTILGSFFNVLVQRTIKEESIVGPFSKCDYCNKRLSFYNMIPLLSYFIQRGKTSCCNKKLPILYPVSEFATGLLFLFIYILEKDLVVGIVVAFLISFLISMSIIDFLTKDIYYIHIFIVLILSVILSRYQFWFFEELLYKAVFVLVFLLLGYLLSIRGYVGFGDIVLIISLNISLNFFETTIFLFLMSLIGGFVGFVLYFKKRDRKVKLAFVPIISSAFILLEILKAILI